VVAGLVVGSSSVVASRVVASRVVASRVVASGVVAGSVGVGRSVVLGAVFVVFVGGSLGSGAGSEADPPSEVGAASTVCMTAARKRHNRVEKRIMGR
jgi:hypothetical protein